MSHQEENLSPLLETILRDRLSEFVETTEHWPVDTLALARESAEKAVIGLALSKHNFNMTQTAKSLGIARKTLYAKMRQHQMPSGRGALKSAAPLAGNGHTGSRTDVAALNGYAPDAAGGNGNGQMPSGVSANGGIGVSLSGSGHSPLGVVAGAAGASEAAANGGGNGQSPPETGNGASNSGKTASFQGAKRRALVSVSDKTGLVDLCRRLDGLGIEIVATGGTARAIGEAGIAHTSVEELTGLAEMMDGRVKTLHPHIFAPILARLPADAGELARAGLDSIDFVVVNLYPFSKVVEREDADDKEIVENIDIGGVALLRAAAKNHERVVTLCSPTQYPQLLQLLESGKQPDFNDRKRWATEAFAHTSLYDKLICSWMARIPAPAGSGGDPMAAPASIHLDASESEQLRYGENPHQAARYFPERGRKATWHQLQGRRASYNNLVDGDCAITLMRQLPAPACVIVKHDTPCAVAIGTDALDSFERAYATDTESPFGGIIAFNAPIDKDVAEAITSRVFTEIVIAPAFSDSSLGVFATKKNLRLFACPAEDNTPAPLGLKRLLGGYLLQQPMATDIELRQTGSVSLDEARVDLMLAWQVVACVHSNAIVVVRGGRTVGISGGQTSRVRAVNYALALAEDFIKENPQDEAPLVLASDAFFPFRDSVDRAAQSGIKAIVQPGGSIRDKEVIAAADEHGIALYFTGTRVFRH